jgi:hypothetical protein
MFLLQPDRKMVTSDRVDKALQLAGFVYMGIGAIVALNCLVLVWFSGLEGTGLELVTEAVSILWLGLFMGLPVVAFVWLVHFWSLASAAHELRLARLLMVLVILLWSSLLIGFVFLFAMLARGLFNLL